MFRHLRKFQKLSVLLIIFGMLYPILPRLQFARAQTQTIDVPAYYRDIARMSPNLLVGAGRPLAEQIQAANGNLTLINNAFQNAIQYAIETNNQSAVQEAFNLYQSFIRPALERQFALTNTENQNNIATLGGTLQNGLSPTLTQLNTLINNNVGSGIIGSNQGFVATPQNTQQLAQVFNQLLALQGNRNAQIGLGGAFNPGINTADMAEGNFNILNIVQGVRALTADNVPGAIQAGGAATILNSIGLDPNVAGPLSAVAGLLLQNDRTSNNLGTSLGGVSSGLPQVTNLVGGLLGNILGGSGTVSQSGGAIREFVTGTTLNELRNRSVGQSVVSPAGLGAASQRLSNNVGAVVQGVRGLATGMTDKVKELAGNGALEAVAGGASPNPVAAAMGMGGGSSCSAGGQNGGSAQGGQETGAGANPNDPAYQRDFDYLTDPNGGGMSRDDAAAILQNYGTGFAPDGYTSTGRDAGGSLLGPTQFDANGNVTGGATTGGAGRTTTDANGRTVYDGSRLQGSDTPRPGIPSINPGPGQTNTSGTRTVVDGSRLQPSDRPSPTADNTYLSPGRVGTTATNRNTVSSGTLADGVTLPANSNGNPASRGTQMGQQVLQTLLQNIGRSGSSGGQGGAQYGGQTQQNYRGYPAAPTYAPSTITPAMLEAQLRAEFLRQLYEASTTPVTSAVNIGGEVSLSPATTGSLTQLELPSISDLASRAGSSLLNFDSGPASSAFQGGLNTLLNGGSLSDIARSAGEASITMLGNKLLSSNPVVQGALTSMLGGGGGKGVPVQVQKGAFFSMVEGNLKSILKTNQKQLECDTENVRIQRRFEKSKYNEDPDAAREAKDDQKKSDDATKEQIAERLVQDWQKYFKDRRLDTIKRDSEKNLAVSSCGPTKEVLTALAREVEQTIKDPNSYSQSLVCPAGVDNFLQQVYSNQSNLTLADIKRASGLEYNALFQLVKTADRQRALAEESDRITMGQLIVSKGIEPKTDKPIARADAETGAPPAWSPDGGQPPGAPANPPPKIIVPLGLAAAEAENIVGRAGKWSLVTKTKPEKDRGLAADAPSGLTQQTLNNFTGQTQTQQPPSRGGDDGGTDWAMLLRIGVAAYCLIDSDSPVCGGGNNPPPPPPPVVVPNLLMITSTSTINSMLESIVSWGAEGVTSCSFSNDWISFGTGTEATTEPTLIGGNNSSAEIKRSLFVYHPQVFKAEVSFFLGEETAGRREADRFKTRIQKIYPAPGYTNKTALIQESVYSPNVAGLTGTFEIKFGLNGNTVTIPDVPATEASPQAIAGLIRDAIATATPGGAIRQFVQNHQMVFTALDGKLTIRGMKIVDGQIPETATYSLSCTGNNGAPLQKSVNIRFGGDRIE